MNTPLDVVIVGAGPYGLSLAAHLQALGTSFQIFGPPMDIWREHMPKGMLLKSDGFASNLSDPKGRLTLENFCAKRGIKYDNTREPVAIETFIDYALAFQRELVPQLDTRRVADVDRETNNLYKVRLEDGETVTAKRVILAVGISYFSYLPPSLETLPKNLVTHSSDHKDPSLFQGKSVTVVGAGASAIDIAALLHESGAKVSVVARASKIRFHDPPADKPRSLWQRMRNPTTGLGPGWKSRFYTDAPRMFRYFPESRRLRIVKQHLGPAPGWPMKARVEGKITMLLDTEIAGAEVVNDRIRLSLTSNGGKTQEHETEHVISATGYRPNLKRLTLLSDGLRSKIHTTQNSPALSANFESSVPGLYFVGIAAANTFGPMMRFAYGADYTAHRLSRHLHRQANR